MSLNGLLRHTCTIEPTTSTTNRLNESSKGYGTAVNSVACLYQVRRVRHAEDERAENLVVNEDVLFLKPSQDIKAGYRITNIKDSNGNDVAPGTWFAEENENHVTPKKKHHQTVGLKR